MIYSNNLTNTTRDWVWARHMSGLCLCAVFAVAPLLFLWDIPEPDVALRYAPMAEAIAANNAETSFHPRIPPLLPVMGAVFVWLTGLNGFWGVKLASAACFVFAVVPLYGIFRRAYSEKIAVAGCLLYIFCSYILRLSYSGLRETPKSLALITAAYALLLIWDNRKSLGGYLLLGIGCGAAVLIRDDCVAISIGLLIFAAMIDLGGRRIPWRTFMSCALALLVMSPMLYYNYRTVGYPVPSSRFAGMAQKLFPPVLVNEEFAPVRMDEPAGNHADDGANRAGEEGAANTETNGLTKFINGISASSIGYFIKELLKGLYVPFTIPALYMIYRRRRDKLWSAKEGILLFLIVGHTVLQILQIAVYDHTLFVERRYLLPAVPLAFGWTALFAQMIYRKLSRLTTPAMVRMISLAISLLMAGALYFDALTPILKLRYSGRKGSARISVQRWAPLIQSAAASAGNAADFELDIHFYRSHKHPLVACRDLPELGYLARGESYVHYVGTEDLFAGAHPVADYVALVLAGNVPPPIYDGYEPIDILQMRDTTYVLLQRSTQ